MQVPINQQLEGDNAFYKAADYQETTQREMASRQPLPTSYKDSTENSFYRFVKTCLSVIIFPLGIYKLVQHIAANTLLNAASSTYCAQQKERPTDYQALREQVYLGNGWAYKRLTLEVDSQKIDTLIMGKKGRLDSKRWVVHAGGEMYRYENELDWGDVKSLADKTGSNAIVFNYPSANRETMEKAYRLILKFAEDQQNGLGASELILSGHSIGCGVIADAMQSHQFNPETKKVIVMRDGFCDMATAADKRWFKGAGLIVRLLGLNYKPAKAIERADCHSFILNSNYDDGVVSAEASLMNRLKNGDKPEKAILVFSPESHHERLRDNTIKAFASELVDKLA